jgi:hypothetical protein
MFSTTRSLALLAAVLAVGCGQPPPEEPNPPSLAEAPRWDDRVAEGSEQDLLVLERRLEWWNEPTAQRSVLFLDGDALLLRREFWTGSRVYAWSEARLTAAGEQGLAAALAAVDPEALDPAPGDYDCAYVHELPVTLRWEGELIEYRPSCPPAGFVELAAFYEDLTAILLECPSTAADWYGEELPVEVLDCDAVELEG